MAAIATLAVDFSIPGDYSTTGTVTVTDRSPWPVGSTILVPIPLSQYPYVGLVIGPGINPGDLFVRTLSTGSLTFGDTITHGPNVAVAFGNPSGGFTAGPLPSAGFPRKVFWPTDPTIFNDPATGDGVIHDDAPAIQNALDLASTQPGGGIVMLPAGTFKCSSPLYITPGTDSDNPTSGIHLWGVGREATILLQDFNPTKGSLPGVIVASADDCSVRHLTIRGPGSGDGEAPTAVSPTPSAVPPTPDISLGSGWAILVVTAARFLVEDVIVDGTAYALGFLGSKDGKVRFCESEGVSGQYVGLYVQGTIGDSATVDIDLGPIPSPSAGDILTAVLTDDEGFEVSVAYRLQTADVSLSVLAVNFANAINNSAASYFLEATASGTTVTLTALLAGLQGNDFTVICSTTGVGVAPTDLTHFQHGAGNKGGDLQALNYQVRAEETDISEAYHVDGGTGTITLRACSALRCGYAVRVTNTVSGSNNPKGMLIFNVEADHTNSGMVFEMGHNLHIMDSGIGATRSTTPAIDIQKNWKGAIVTNNKINQNGKIVGVQISASKVHVSGNNIDGNKVGIALGNTDPDNAVHQLTDIQISGNYINAKGKDGIGIDASSLTDSTGSDMISIIGNTVFVDANQSGVAMAFPTSGGITNLGPNSRISNNTGLNPIEPTTTGVGTPAVSSSGVAARNPYHADCTVSIVQGSGTTLNSITLTAPSGTVQTFPTLAGTGATPVIVPVRCGYSIALSYTVHIVGAKPTWYWLPT